MKQRVVINEENFSIVVGFVKGGKADETLVDMSKTSKFDAESITSVILESLEKCGLNPKDMISQCLDGANVMSGKHGGVQRKFQENVSKRIFYTFSA